MRSNLRASQNGRSTMNLVYSGGSTMVSTRVKILGFRISECLNNTLSRTFFFIKLLKVKIRILHFLCENCAEYQHDITIRVLITVYSIPQHNSWFKITNCIDSQTLSCCFFCLWQNNLCSFWHGSTAHDKDGNREWLMHHCVKCVQVQSFFWSVISCIWTRKTSVFGQYSRSDLISLLAARIFSSSL